MDVAQLIKQRLTELAMDQKDLAVATQVTESYISQLLTRKKLPPAPARTDVYEKIGQFLKLPAGELAKLAEVQRHQELKRKVADPPAPLFKECRDLILRKCDSASLREVQRIFEKEPFGELERLVTQKLLDTAQGVAREELRNEQWLRLMAEMSDRSYEQMRVAVLEFLDSDVFHVTIEGCVSFLDPIINAWSVDLRSFGIEIELNPRLSPRRKLRFEFVEMPVEQPAVREPGFEEFLKDQSLSSSATEEEVEFLRTLKFKGRRPNALYYYRELQGLRDPIHFRPE